MATGSLDANGIWIYGEDDSEPTFSGLLNKLGDSTSDAIGPLLSAGRILLFANKTDRDAYSGTKYEGLLCFVNSTDSYYSYNGASWDIFSKQETTYTPTVTGATRSAGDLKYSIKNDIMHIWGQITFSAVSGDVYMTFPSGYERPATGADRLQNGIAILADVGTANYQGMTRTTGPSANTFQILASRASGTYTDLVFISPTIPFTWASGDVITVNLHSPIVEV